ncbi:MRG family protein [Ostreococcus tauri]|uniref:MRG family protein n=1 Tax=Ostreococcus tauri TaxID=70448 RepID=A0A1Y5I3W6_OSTTA|nr:MRG family protein [Ostreococcus tauri]
MTPVERASAEGDGRVIRITAPASVRRALLRDYEDSRGTDPRPYERPRATVREIFRAFLEEQRTTTDSRGKPLSAASVARAEKTCAGLERAFDDALERALLYKDEWHQRSPLPPSETYGAVHLLRMLVKLPAIFPPESFADVKSATILQSKANELVRFVCAKASDFGVADAFASNAPIRPPSTPDNVDEPPSRV